MMQVDWQKLAVIRELQEYFESDFEGFKQQIKCHFNNWANLQPAELDKLAILRALEVTNGCIQWGYRRQDEQCLSVEQTRACMQKVIGFIRRKQIDLPSGRTLTFTPQIETLIEEGRELFQLAFKKNNEAAQQEYYASSTAQFVAYGVPRIEMALDLVRQEFESLFTDYYLQRGHNYIAPYLRALTVPT